MHRLRGLLAAAAVLLLVHTAAAEALSSPPPEAETPSPVARVSLKDGLLTVELSGAPFGDVMRQIASKSGIRVDVAADVAVLPITTRFRAVELEEGILRLLSLARNRNYFMTYDPQGRLKAVEIHSAEPAAGLPKKPAAAGQNTTRTGEAVRPAPPQPVVRKNPPASERIIRRQKAGETGITPVREDPFEDMGPADSDNGQTGISAEKAPPYIPPPPRRK